MPCGGTTYDGILRVFCFGIFLSFLGGGGGGGVGARAVNDAHVQLRPASCSSCFPSRCRDMQQVLHEK